MTELSDEALAERLGETVTKGELLRALANIQIDKLRLILILNAFRDGRTEVAKSLIDAVLDPEKDGLGRIIRELEGGADVG